MTIIGNIGIGIFILTILWILTLFIVVIGVRLQSNISWIILGLATAITILLLIIPTDKEIQLNKLDIEEDYWFIYKNILLSILLLSCIVGFGSFFVIHCTSPIHPDAIQSFYCEYE